MKKKLIILSGIPCSGKSTYAKFVLNKNKKTYVLSRDVLREKYFGKDYIHTNQDEKFITEKFFHILNILINNPNYDQIVLDNTFCRETYINEIIKLYGKIFDIQIIFFDCSLIKAYFRNILRYIKTKKWIPFKIIKSMHKQYNSINKNKYKNLLD